jgi:hypothetical protein
MEEDVRNRGARVISHPFQSGSDCAWVIGALVALILPTSLCQAVAVLLIIYSRRQAHRQAPSVLHLYPDTRCYRFYQAPCRLVSASIPDIGPLGRLREMSVA